MYWEFLMRICVFRDQQAESQWLLQKRLSYQQYQKCIIIGTVCLAEGEKLPTDNALLEANDHTGKDDILNYRTCVRSGENVPDRLMTTELDPKTIYPGTTIA